MSLFSLQIQPLMSLLMIFLGRRQGSIHYCCRINLWNLSIGDVYLFFSVRISCKWFPTLLYGTIKDRSIIKLLYLLALFKLLPKHLLIHRSHFLSRLPRFTRVFIKIECIQLILKNSRSKMWDDSNSFINSIIYEVITTSLPLLKIIMC